MRAGAARINLREACSRHNLLSTRRRPRASAGRSGLQRLCADLQARCKTPKGVAHATPRMCRRRTPRARTMQDRASPVARRTLRRTSQLRGTRRGRVRPRPGSPHGCATADANRALAAEKACVQGQGRAQQRAAPTLLRTHPQRQPGLGPGAWHLLANAGAQRLPAAPGRAPTRRPRGCAARRTGAPRRAPCRGTVHTVRMSARRPSDDAP